MSLVDYRTDGPVAVSTPSSAPSNAPANCCSLELGNGLDEAGLRARFDDSVHGIIRTGAGHRCFCAGADIAMLEAVTPRYKYYFCLHTHETLLRLEQGLALERERRRLFRRADAREGIEASNETRNPQLRGE